MSYHFYVSDIVIPMYSALLTVPEHELELRARKLMMPFFRGYKSAYTIDSHWLNAAPLFIRFRDLLMKYVFDLWQTEPGNAWVRQVERNLEHGNPLCRLPWRLWYEEA